MNTLVRSAAQAVIEAEIEYLAPDSIINRRFVAPGAELQTTHYVRRSVHMHNARLERDRLTLDAAGFTLLDHRSAVRDFLDKDEVGRIYPDEACAAVREALGADHVFPLGVGGWVIRTSGDADLLKTSTGYSASGAIQPPGAEAHVDMHFASADKRIEQAYAKLMPAGKGYSRAVASSFWRVFTEPPQDWPLAVCDGTSLADDEGLPNTMIVTDSVPDETTMYAPIRNEGEMMAASVFHYRPGHRWYYYPDMVRDEALLFKFYDTDHSRAWRVPHTAFNDTSRPDAQTRRSIEFRTIAFFD